MREWRTIPRQFAEAEFTALKSRAQRTAARRRELRASLRNAARLSAGGWPFDAAEARRRQSKAAPSPSRSIELGHGIKLDLVIIPGRRIRQGSTNEGAQSIARIKEGFWMAAREMDNRTYALFDPSPRQPRRGQEYVSIRRARLPVERAGPAGGARIMGRSLRVLPVAKRPNRREVHPAERGPVGIRLPGRHARRPSTTAISTPISPPTRTWRIAACRTLPAILTRWMCR